MPPRRQFQRSKRSMIACVPSIGILARAGPITELQAIGREDSSVWGSPIAPPASLDGSSIYGAYRIRHATSRTGGEGWVVARGFFYCGSATAVSRPNR